MRHQNDCQPPTKEWKSGLLSPLDVLVFTVMIKTGRPTTHAQLTHILGLRLKDGVSAAGSQIQAKKGTNSLWHQARGCLLQMDGKFLGNGIAKGHPLLDPQP